MQYGHEPQLNLNRMGKPRMTPPPPLLHRCPAHSCAHMHVGLVRLSLFVLPEPGVTLMASFKEARHLALQWIYTDKMDRRSFQVTVLCIHLMKKRRRICIYIRRRFIYQMAFSSSEPAASSALGSVVLTLTVSALCTLTTGCC